MKTHLPSRTLTRFFWSIITLLLTASGGLAATFTVTNTANSGTGSLRWSIGQAFLAPGVDTIQFDPTFFNVPRTIRVTSGDIIVQSSININGPGKDLLTIDGDGINRGFVIENGTVVINDLKIANGAGRQSVTIKSGAYAGTFQPARGGAIYNKGNLTLNRVTIENCQAFPSSIGTTSSRGGAVFNETTLNINDCTLRQNIALASTENAFAAGPLAWGGAIYNEVDGVITITGSSITDNKARGFINRSVSGQLSSKAYGGGIFNRGTITLDSTSVAQNRAEAVCDYVDGIPVSAQGGGIDSIGSLTVRNGCQISANVVLVDTTGSKGIATAYGGGIAGGNRIVDSTIAQNLVELYNDDAGSASGGGLSGVGLVKNCRVVKNRVLVEASGEPTSSGGGLSGVEEILGSLIAENTAEVVSVNTGTASGGGINANDGTTISNSTIAGNRCTADGYRGFAYSGGIHLTNGTLTARNLTVAVNECVSTGTDWSVAYGAGLSANGGANFSIGNSIIVGNTISASTGTLIQEIDPDISFGWGSAGFNLVGDIGGQSGFTTGDQTGISPATIFIDSNGNGTIDLADLQLNGGSTETLALLAQGPATDAGNNALVPIDPDTGLAVTSDQRGSTFARITNSTVDIGSFEVDLPPTAPVFTFNNRRIANQFENRTDIADIGSTDPEGQPITYTLNGTDAAFFDLDPTTGTLSFKNAPDYENPQDFEANNTFWFSVTASDGLNESKSNFTVRVLNSNDPPTSPELNNTTVAENSVEVGAVSAEDQDGDPITFQLTGGPDQSLFTIDTNSGDLRFINAPDYENPADEGQNNTYEIEVSALSNFQTSSSTFEITVTNVDEPSSAPIISRSTIEEHTREVGTVTSIDPEDDDIFYVINGGVDQALFEIDLTTGALSFRTPPDFENPSDDNGDNHYQVQVGAQTSTTVSTLFEIEVTDVQEQFVFTGAIDNDFLNPDNWSNISGAIATPSNMAVEVPYIVANSATLSGAATLEGNLIINPGATLTITATTGSFTQNGGSDVLIANGGSISNFGNYLINATGTQANPTTLTNSNLSGFINQVGATFQHRGTGFSILRAKFTNHGIVHEDENLLENQAFWEAPNFNNAATGTVTFRAGANTSFSVTNAGLFNLESFLDSDEGGVRGTNCTNSGTFNAPVGISPGNGGEFTNEDDGILNLGGFLFALRNSGTVNLTGNSTFAYSTTRDLSCEFLPGSTLNQGQHQLAITDEGFRFGGTWNSSGEIRIFRDTSFTVTNTGTITNNGSWTYSIFGLIDPDVPATFSLAGTLSGSAPLTIPSLASLELAGGDLAGPVISNGSLTIPTDSTVSGSLTLKSDFTIPTNRTLTVALGGSLTVDAGAELSITEGGHVSVLGTIQLNSNGTSAKPTTISGSRVADQGLRIEASGTYTRSGIGYSLMNVRVTNHGMFMDDPGLDPRFATWDYMHFTNSATGTVTLYTRAGIIESVPISIGNAGTFNAYTTLDEPGLGNRAKGFTNSGTLNILNNVGLFDAEGKSGITNHSTGVVNGRGMLGGLINHGTVNLNGDAEIARIGDNSDLLNLRPSRNEAGGTINQGPHRLLLNWLVNEGTWTGSGKIEFLEPNSYLTIGPGGVLENDGSWSFFPFGSPQNTITVAGTLGGASLLDIPATCSLKLAGGELAGHVIARGINTITADSTVTGTLTLFDSALNGAGKLRVEGSLGTAGSGTSTVNSPLTLNNSQGRVIKIATGTELETNGALTYTAGNVCVDGTWDHQQSPLTIPGGANLVGTGTLEGNVEVLGQIKPGPTSGGLGNLSITGDLSIPAGGAAVIEVQGIAAMFDTIAVSGVATLGGEVIADFTDRPLADPGNYYFLNATAVFGSFATQTPLSLAATRSLGYSPENFAVFTVSVIGTPYEDWALISGLTTGVNDGLLDDPNKDGTPNIHHFAFDTHPLAPGGGHEGKRRLASDLIEGQEHLTLTLPVRRGASFTGAPGMEATIDRIVYHILGDDNLLGPKDLEIEEVTPALSTGLPALRDLDGNGTADWEYHTFRLSDPVSSRPAGFIITGVAEDR